ncbi:MAG: molecular chaperone [Burkholderiaceae bacterium]
MTVDSPQQSSTSSEGIATASVAPPLGTDQKLRIGAYTLIASLLRDAPDQAVLDYLIEAGRNATDTDDIGGAMHDLATAAAACSTDQANEEFHDLFVGIGRGELVPFGSWYLTGFLMEKPLSLLRTDLAELGFERQPEVVEPEDHAAALAEVMAMLISDGTVHETQLKFFTQHMGPWMGRFMSDLQNAKSANFYRSVGKFGAAFISLESRYFEMQA